jgi:uncharacterized protein YcaQ
LREYAIARSLFRETTLDRAVERLGFVQADPIRAPARAQDLTLRHRVRGYRAGDLERRYPELEVEEDFFINYGFLPRRHLPLMLPRESWRTWNATTRRRAKKILALVRASGHGALHPRDAERAFGLGRVTNYWGGSSNATTHLLDQMQYRGLLRVVRRESGIRLYGERLFERSTASRRVRADALLDLCVRLYAPLPAASLVNLASRLQWGAPHLESELRRALARAKTSLARERIDGVEWFWPADESPEGEAPERARLLAPFDPVVWDRRRFQLFWGWRYRFEAYTPVKKRKLGYYALPLLWRDAVVGWANVRDGAVVLGWAAGKPPRDRAFPRELDAELERLRAFLR